MSFANLKKKRQSNFDKLKSQLEGLSPKNTVTEEEYWKPMLGKIVNSSKCDLLLTKFEGANSNLFQMASRFHQTMKQSLFLYEIKKSLDKPINFKVCKYYKNEEMPTLDDKNLALYFQKEVEKY